MQGVRRKTNAPWKAIEAQNKPLPIPMEGDRNTALAVRGTRTGKVGGGGGKTKKRKGAGVRYKREGWVTGK